ncbi:MAG TPA: aminotransferase class V-fold PLP-dependent enzyme [Candidatus Acidoferrales bacterium]|nr:aminotransferase class V-fold PLP-dependent enzyme [Candidatus Acidoferrales bacterium]
MPARFGHAQLGEWPLDPAITYLNHGTVGVAPNRVLAVQQAVRDAMDRQPATFLFRDANHLGGRAVGEKPRMRSAAAEVAQFLGAGGYDLVFVDNATAGVNAVLRSIVWHEGDEVLVMDHSYGAVVLAARAITRFAGATVREAVLPWPASTEDGVVEAILSALGPRTRLAILDHVTSSSALVLPLARLVEGCHARGVAVLVDGAHAPGMLALDLPALGADWYAANMHKWAYAPRSSGILWAAPARQAGLHPPVISWGLDRGFTAEFDWMGTRDPSPWLAAPEGVRTLRELDVEAVRAWNHALAWDGARRIASATGGTFAAPESMIGSMATITLPESYGTSPDDAQRLRDALLFDDRIEVAVGSFRNRVWMRICGQVYVEEGDLQRLERALLAKRR